MLCNLPPPRSRRRHVERLVRGEGVATHPSLSYDAKLFYTVCALACNEVGVIKKDAAAMAMHDPTLVSAAMNILTKCGCPPVGGVLS
jgi:hypothetical protein